MSDTPATSSGVITSQLASNAITLIMPGGAPVGAAVQFRMLATSGLDTSSTVGGLAAFSLLGVGGPIAYGLFRIRYRSRRSTPQTAVAGT